MIYVDDLLVFGTDNNEIASFKQTLSNNFHMKDLGLAKNYLGITIKQNKGATIISQEKYLLAVLDKFKMTNCKAISTPMDQNFNVELLKRDKSESIDVEMKCRQLIGCLMYAVSGTRPDLCVAVGFLSRFQHCASEILLKSLKRVLRYIKGTLTLSLIYKSNDSGIQGFVDADWAGDVNDRKSTSGYLFKIHDCLVSWYCKKQFSVSLSSTESEYIALSTAITEACLLKNLLNDFNMPNCEIEIFEDNQSVIKLVYNNENNKRLKHIDVRYHYIMEKVKENFVNLKYVKTEDNVADILTKPLGKILFEKCRSFMLKVFVEGEY